MKTPKFKLLFILLSTVVFAFTSCLDTKVEEINDLTSLSEFDFKTTKQYSVSISALNNENQPFSGVQLKLFTQNPLNEDGTLKADSIIEKILIYTGNTNTGGILNCQIAPATTVDSLSILVNQIGLPSLITVKLSSAEVNVVIGGSNQIGIKASNVGPLKVDALASPTLENGFYTLGSWDNQGIPKYLSKPNDIITNSLLADINTSLPEYKKLTDSHPQYLEDTNDGSVKLYEDAEVWVTFVHEGAGYMNTLGYYTYKNGNPPASISDIKDKTVIYPNVSFGGSGGGLVSGNKVQLLYLDPITKTYTKIFPAGTTVAWVLHAMGWSGKDIKTINNSYTYYSDSKLNPESDTKLKKHNVILNDAERKLLIVSFEDVRRDQSSDNDFNDAIFYATTNPYTAIKQTEYKVVDKPLDTDKDGITDVNDEYPTDARKAYNNYYPSKNNVGTLAFEDLWPYKGDYDFNDLVVDYNFNQITNAANQTIAIEAQLTVRAIGASYKNGFGIEFNTTADNVLSVSGQKITERVLSLASNGAENNQEKAVIIAFDNAFSVTPHPGNGLSVNTVTGELYQTPGIVNLKIEFKNPISYSEMGTAPYNPFIFINGDRAKEVHLPGSTPTNLADKSLLGTGYDNSDVSRGKYYMSDKYLPWAINIPTKFDYPAEKQDITKAFLNFNKWTASNGFNNMDWYLNLNGYRDASKIFKK